MWLYLNVFDYFTEIDYCVDKPCKKGVCNNIVGAPGYTCTCDIGYTGKNCDVGKNSINTQFTRKI